MSIGFQVFSEYYLRKNIKFGQQNNSRIILIQFNPTQQLFSEYYLHKKIQIWLKNNSLIILIQFNPPSVLQVLFALKCQIGLTR